MFDESAPALELEEVISGELTHIRNSAINALFLSALSDRKRSIDYLREKFPNLKGGGVRGNYVVLELQLESCLRFVRAAEIPERYMDVAQHYFELTN